MSAARHAADIAADIEQTRDRLALGIDAIHDRLRPQRLQQQARDKIRDLAWRNVGKLLRYARRHPVPALMIGAGVGWLLTVARGNGAAD
jgi:hypothetical protein